jgi:tRNA(fMet)-specific endonuclease VapC
MASVLLLDTNILLAFVRGSGPVARAAAPYLNHADQLLISVVSQGELRVLAQRNKWGPAKLQAMMDALNALVSVNIAHPAVMDAYVNIDTQSSAQNMGKNDLWIAACALATGATLLTTDRDFDHLHPNTLRVIRIG